MTGCFYENKIDESKSTDTCEKKNTVQDCQQWCQETSGCKRFYYITECYKWKNMRKDCCLIDTAVPDYKMVQNVVSGPAQCPTSKFLDLFMFICGRGILGLRWYVTVHKKTK